ncbi:MAG: alpha/beta fold hydrolase, partial [Thermomicrobiales bacterium]
MVEPESAQVEVGRIATAVGHVAYRRVNPGLGLPLLVIHGGPGAGHRYLRKLERLATNREIVFYDQLGCGDSLATNEAPAEGETLWEIQRFADEIDFVREHLGLTDVHLLGHSSGGWLALEYLSRQPDGVRSAILANTAASIADFSRGINGLVDALDDAARRVIRSYE